MKIVLGSDRAAKVAAVRATIERIATLDAAWREAEIIARAVVVSVPAMPLNDAEMMRGARERAWTARELLRAEGAGAGLYVGLEGGFQSHRLDGQQHTFLRGWAYATDGEREGFGVTPSISVPPPLARRVSEEKIELGVLIDEVAGQHDVRSRQGAWGVLSRDLLTRSMSFEAALIAAFAPFYNAEFYA